MKILVLVKRVPDPYGRIRLTDAGIIDESEIRWVINPFDEIALEEAVRLRESGLDCEIVAVALGSAEWADQLRAALAMGADRAILATWQGPDDSRSVSRRLAEICRQEAPDLILAGKQAIDDDANQVGQRVAALLGLPQATCASAITISSDGAYAVVVREVDEGRETLEVKLPAVITTDLRLNEPRYVALPAIVKARSRPLQTLDADPSEASSPAGFRIVKQAPPPARKAGRKVAGVDELVAALRDEARVI
ncbi:MAG: electron transfer flavoprotein subunit beta/FixA family protein [Armatimonadetes bacterium]|nr:electron transfer flavoprotein subunit beta/FixA family protein [Armatimonadota bacterium]MDE2206055.1 electron transfer flavoprotein subunit beta/FixA family protein [Armatimonadota bacterium]